MITASNAEIEIIDTWINIIHNKGGEVSLKEEYQKRTGVVLESGKYNSDFQITRALLLNHGLIEGTPRTGMDQGYVLSAFGHSVYNAGGFAKYFQREETQNRYTDALTKSNLINNRFLIPLQIALTAIIMAATCYQGYIYHEQLVISQKQLKLQERSESQQLQQPIKSETNKTKSSVVPKENQQTPDSALVQ